MSDQSMAGNTDAENLSDAESAMAADRGPGGMPSATEGEMASDKSGTESMDEDADTSTS